MKLLRFCRVLAASLLSTFCLAQNRDTLETKVSADGNMIQLEWTKKHPWDGDLQRWGATLAAEYRTQSQGMVAQILSRAPGPGPNQRLVRFALPDALTAAPQGPVCLYVQAPNQRLLLVRKANERGEETLECAMNPHRAESSSFAALARHLTYQTAVG